MISENITKAIAQITAQGKHRFLNGATNEQLLAFESNNGIALPLQYKEWLRFSDGGELFLPAGVQLYGVAHNPIIDISDSNKPSEEYVVIGALASGDPILCSKKGEQIAVYNYNAGRIEEDEIYQDFYAFLNDLYALLGIGE